MRTITPRTEKHDAGWNAEREALGVLAGSCWRGVLTLRRQWCYAEDVRPVAFLRSHVSG